MPAEPRPKIGAGREGPGPVLLELIHGWRSGAPAGPAGAPRSCTSTGSGLERAPLAAEFLVMNSADVEIVEVFSGPSSIPAEYGTAHTCAIGIWTRRGE